MSEVLIRRRDLFECLNSLFLALDYILLLLLILLDGPKQLVEGNEYGDETKKQHPNGKIHLASFLDLQPCPGSEAYDRAHLKSQANVFYINRGITLRRPFFAVLHCR